MSGFSLWNVCNFFCLQNFLTSADRFSSLEWRLYFPFPLFPCVWRLCGWRWKTDVNLTNDRKLFAGYFTTWRYPMCISSEDTFFSPSITLWNQNYIGWCLKWAFVWIFVPPQHDPVKGHTPHKEAQGTRNSVVFVPSELCLFKGGLVCEAEALNNN